MRFTYTLLLLIFAIVGFVYASEAIDSVASVNNIETYFILAALISILAVWGFFYTSKLKKHKSKYKGKGKKTKESKIDLKKPILISVLILIVAGLAYSLYIAYITNAASQGVIVCIESGCVWSTHIHADVDVDICGEDIRLPIEKGSLTLSHTHEEKNKIHFHERIPIDKDTRKLLNTTPLKLGTFFDEIGVAFGSDYIGEKRNGDLCDDTSTLKMFVNGKPNADFRDYVWRDGDHIKLVFDERVETQITETTTTSSSTFLAPQISLPIIVGLALVDSINPCVIGVLILLITVLLKAKKRRSVLINGFMYTAGVYVTYILAGLLLFGVINSPPFRAISQFAYAFLGGFIILAGFLEIKDFFWYGRGFSLAIPARFVHIIEGGARSTHTSLLAAFSFGAIVTLIEMPCTGAPYLAVITMMSQSGMQFAQALALLLLYNLVFVLPLLAIIYMGYKGVGTKKMENWRHEQKGRMRLVVGLFLLAIGIWIISFVQPLEVIYILAASCILLIFCMYILKRFGLIK